MTLPVGISSAAKSELVPWLGVVVAAPARLAGSMGNMGWLAVEPWIVDFSSTHAACRAGDVETDRVAHLGPEIRVGLELERLHAMRLQAEGSPNAKAHW